MELLVDSFRRAVEGIRPELGAEAQEVLTMLLGGLDIIVDKQGPGQARKLREWQLNLPNAVRDMKQRYR